MELALEAGYGAHEAFTRAFSAQFGTTPEQVRARACTRHLELQEPLWSRSRARTRCGRTASTSRRWAAICQQIFEHGLASAGLVPEPAPMFERHGDAFDPRTGNGGLEVWVPVRA